MRRNTIMILIIFLLLSQLSNAQIHERPFGPAPERIEKYKKLRLIEELNLSDETAIRFSKLYNAHLDSLREIRRKMDEYQNDLGIYLEKGKYYQDRGNEYNKYLKDFRKILKDYEDCQKKFWETNKNYTEKLKQLLNEEQLAKYYLFEKKFNKELRDALDQLRENMPKRRMR